MEMKVTRIKTKHGKWGKPLAMTVEELAAAISSDKWQTEVERIALTRHRDRLPYVIFSGLFDRQGLHCLRQPTGLMLLSIDLPADPTRAALLRHSVEQLPQTVMAFTGVSRHTLKVVVRCQPANGLLPTDSTAYLSFLSLAQQQAARYIEAMCGCEVPLVEESLQRGCRLSQDAQVYVNAGAVPLTVLSTVAVLAAYPLARTDRYGNTVSEPKWADIERQRADFYACLTRAQETVTLDPADPASAEALVVELARLCRKSALPEEACVQRTGFYRQWHLSVDEVRRIFRTVYQRNDEGRPWSQMTEKERIARKVRDFFERRYELRYNVMRRAEEFRPRGIDYHPWMPLTERDINRIGQEQMLDCGAAWPIDIKQYAQSSLVADYNPVHEFLAGCGSWDRQRDYIGELARRVPCRYAEWPQLFHRWFLGMVAAWLGRSRDHANGVVPMLIGAQGCRKSTFCKLLLPHALREYYIDDIKLDNAEQVERMLGRMALVNIDEYNAKTEREQAKIKRVLTERDVQTRRMRSDQYLLLPRVASFVATTNDRQPLTDPTGSRRYICCEVTGVIDTSTPLDHRQVYAQAVSELRHGARWHLTKDEEARLERHNQDYRIETSPEQVLLAWYEPAPRHKDHFVRTVDILKELANHVSKTDLPSVKLLAMALKSCGFPYGNMGGRRGWYARSRQDHT